MADYLTTASELASIANAIRAKGETTGSLVYPNEFVSAINDIEIQPLSVTVYGATVDFIAGSVDDYLLTMKDGTPQSKTTTPSSSQQIILPDPGYAYLSKVTINAIPYTEADNSAGGVTVSIGSSS